MKRSSLLVLMLSMSFFSLMAQAPIWVSGYVTDELTGDPVANHEVHIMMNDSSVYSSIVLTDNNGFYMDSVLTAGDTVDYLYIFTYNLCNYGMHDTIIQNPDPNVWIQADFEICVDSIPGMECQSAFIYYPDSFDQYTYQFIDLSTATYGVENWSWDFGDGTTSTSQNPVHVYNSSGNFQVCLTISADSGTCTSVSCQDIYISQGGMNCEADFYYIIDSSLNMVVNFYDQSTPQNSIVAYSWWFGDGGYSSLQNPVYQYSAPGTYNVCLLIESQDSGLYCVDTTCMDVVVPGTGPDCEADFFYIIDSLQSNTVYFFDISTPAGMVDTWLWNFGDGLSSTQQHPVHTYTDDGSYLVTLTITADSSSCTSTHYDTVVIVTEPQYQMGGNVFAGIYQLDQGFAYAYKSENGVITDVYSGIIDTLGYYLFYPLAPAEYYVKVEPSPSSAFVNTYMPTYYGNAVTWDDAVLINLDQNVYTADINLVPINQAAAGPGQISGNIGYGTTLRNNTPAENIQIMLANQDGEFVGLTYSDEEGKFVFAGLPYGTYSLYAEVTGLNMVPGEFTLTEENGHAENILMIITDDGIYFDPSSVEALDDITISEIYPNPVKTTLKLDIGILDPTSVDVRIVDQLGQVISHQQIVLQHGQTLEISTAELQKGMYFLEVVTKNNFRTARRFVKF